MSNADIMISGEENMRMASVLALRSALKLETRGMKRHGRSARAIANDLLGTNHRTAVKTYAALNAYVVDKLGSQFDRPLT